MCYTKRLALIQLGVKHKITCLLTRNGKLETNNNVSCENSKFPNHRRVWKFPKIINSENNRLIRPVHGVAKLYTSTNKRKRHKHSHWLINNYSDLFFFYQLEGKKVKRTVSDNVAQAYSGIFRSNLRRFPWLDNHSVPFKASAQLWNGSLHHEAPTVSIITHHL